MLDRACIEYVAHGSASVRPILLGGAAHGKLVQCKWWQPLQPQPCNSYIFNASEYSSLTTSMCHMLRGPDHLYGCSHEIPDGVKAWCVSPGAGVPLCRAAVCGTPLSSCSQQSQQARLLTQVLATQVEVLV
jgi:hypothetical protein